MKKGLLIIAILLGLIIFKDIPGVLYILVQADTTTDAWVMNINQIERSLWYNWTGSNTLGNTINTSSDSRIIDLYDEHGNVIYDGMLIKYINNNNAINVGSNGISFSSNSAKIFYNGYLYRTTTYVCSTQALSRYSSTSTTIATQPTTNATYSYLQMISIKVPNDIRSSIDTNITNCYAINALIIPSETAYNVWSRVIGTTNTKIYLIGYNNEVLGNGNNLSSADIQTIINNSGLATANDIDDVNRAIDNMTDEISEQTAQQQANHDELMNKNHTYNNNQSETINGQQDLDNMQDAEEDLMNDLDFSGVNNVNITINPNASNFIWQIVENLRNMNASIVLLFTSILGLGIIKLVLNR